METCDIDLYLGKLKDAEKVINALPEDRQRAYEVLQIVAVALFGSTNLP